MTDKSEEDRRHQVRRSGYEMRSDEDRRHEQGDWPYLEKRSDEDRRREEDRRHSKRRGAETSESP